MIKCGKQRTSLMASAGRLLAAGSLTAVVALGTATTATASSSGPINPNGVLNYGLDLNNQFSNDFDPGTEFNDCSETVLSNIYQSLTTPGNFAIGGGVAQSWTVSPDASTVTFHLRPQLVFSNGSPLTSTTVKESLEHIKMSPLRSSLANITSMDTPDNGTLVVHLSGPTAGDFLWAVSYIDGMVIDPNSIPAASTQPVGSGPFELKSYQQGSSILLTKNPRYFDSSAYPLGGVHFVQVTNGPQAVTALKSGAVDMIQAEPENYQDLKGDPNIGIATTKSYESAVIQLRLNEGVFTNNKVRAALEYAIDRVALNRVVFDNLGTPAYQPWPSWSPAYNRALGNFDNYNPSKAKRLLASAGFPNGTSFTLIVPAGDASYSRMGALLQQEMGAAGFRVNIQSVQGADILSEFYLKKQGDALLSLALSTGADLANPFLITFGPGGFIAKQLGGVNPQITSLVNQAITSISPDVQGPPMQQAGRIAMQQGLAVPLVFEPSIIAYNKQRVGGHVVAPIGTCRSNLAGIYIKS